MHETEINQDRTSNERDQEEAIKRREADFRERQNKMRLQQSLLDSQMAFKVHKPSQLSKMSHIDGLD